MEIESRQGIEKQSGEIRIKAVGDICPGDVSVDGLGVLAVTRKYGADFPFRKLGGMLGGVDLLIGNLEGTLSSKCSNNNLRMCGLPGFARVLHDIGFEVISLANNHVFDHGPQILEETIFCLNDAGLKICGLRGDNDYYSAPVVIQKESLKMGILAYNWVGLESTSKEIEKYIAVVDDSVVNYTWNRNPKKDKEARLLVTKKNKNVLNDIRKLKEEVDVVILMPHWGYEWTIYPPYGVVLEARTFIDAGIDLIIGSHPHIPQGVEIYNGGVIAYSLGNFLFDMHSNKFKNGMVFDAIISKSGVKNYKYFFTTSNDHFQPELASEKEQEVNKELIRASSSAIESDNADERLNDDLIYKEYEQQYNRLKYEKIRYLILALFRHPWLIKPILGKISNFLYLVVLRIRGQKIRW
jgi:poly-gamma-glutamate synthesis protein (capsule biosynthesis protein)